MRALDLTFDRPTDDRVRAEWAALRDAGLPSLARHTAPSNRPHLTLDTREAIGRDAQVALAEVAARLPLGIRVGSVLLFHARQRWVLARHVVVDRSLLELHEQVHRTLGPGGGSLTTPDRWVPHVTLARGVSDAELPGALAVVATSQPFTGRALRLRLWDEAAGEAWDLPPTGPGQSSTGRSL